MPNDEDNRQKQVAMLRDEIARLKGALARQDSELQALRWNADVTAAAENRAALVQIIAEVAQQGGLVEALQRPLTDAVAMVRALRQDRDRLAEEVRQAREGGS